MNYSQALQWLFSTSRFGIRPGLENVRKLLDGLDNPERHPRLLHVAGTNGKGSVCAMAEAICRQNGLRTGLYTSPHLRSFRERIRICGDWIEKDTAAAGLSRIRDLCHEWDPHPTFFEITTVLALDCFQRAGVEVVILETGLGGRLDATNVVDPTVAVITHIALDHEIHLGKGLARIASEKAGIIKTGRPVFTFVQEAEAMDVLRQTAAERDAPLQVIDTAWPTTPALPGEHQRYNAALAVAALRSMFPSLTNEIIETALRELQWPGRFQAVGERFILDGAHNPDAIQTLARTWRSQFPKADPPTLIFGALDDKDYGAMARTLASFCGRALLVTVNSQRAVDAKKLVDIWPENEVEVTALPDLASALRHPWAMQESVLITGSLYLVSEALRILDPQPGDEDWEENAPRSTP